MTRTRRLAGVVVVAGLLGLGFSGWWLIRSTAGPDDDTLLSPEEVEAFEEYPLFSLGEAAEGYPLWLVQHKDVPPDLAEDGTVLSHGAKWVDFIYADCEGKNFTRGDCRMPIVLRMAPICLESCPSRIVRGGRILPSGAVVRSLGGVVRIWSGAVGITYWNDLRGGPTPEQLIAALRPQNEYARAMMNWPSPDAPRTCPPSTVVLED